MTPSLGSTRVQTSPLVRRLAHWFIISLLGSVVAFIAPLLFGTAGLVALACYLGILAVLGTSTFITALVAHDRAVALPSAFALVLIAVAGLLCYLALDFAFSPSR